MSPDSKFLIIDGHSLAYRAFHALPVDKFHSPQGIPVNAVYGLCSMLINLLLEHKPTHIAVCFDEGRDTFRKKLFPEYKANRSASPDEFKVQMSLIRSLIDSFGIKSFSDSAYEADDLIATLATKASTEGLEVLIVTSDRDSFQLISENVNVLYPKKGLSDVVRMDKQEIQNRYGLSPSQYLDFAALRGDPSDNLPSIPGVGEKTATVWIQKYGSLEKLIESQNEVSGKIGESFRSNIETVQLNQKLTRLVSDLSLGVELKSLAWQPTDAIDAHAFCSDLGFKSLLPRIRSITGKTLESPKIASGKLQNFAVIYVNDTSIFLMNNNEVQDATELKKEILETLSSYVFSGIPILTNDLKGLIKHFRKQGAEIGNLDFKNIIDVLILEYLVNPGSRVELEDLIQPNSTDQLFVAESEIADICLAIAGAFDRIRSLENYDQILDLYVHLEAQVAEVLADMELNGIAINEVALSEMIQLKGNEQKALEEKGFKVHGRSFNFGSPKQLQDVLFVERGLTKTKKTKTGYTTDSDALDFLMSKHPEDKLLQILRDWRETSKIRQMLVSLQESIVNGRIHTTFMQTVAATGRLSSTKPNLQNVPIRTEAGRAIRGLFVAKTPYQYLVTADYSQIELRVMAHLANDEALIKAFKSGEDLHISVAAQIFNVSPAEVTSELRNQIKAVSYGLAYGLSSYGLSQSLKIDVSEAELLMTKFFERFAGVRDYLKTVVEEAKGQGYTETILGRRRYLPDLNHENRFRREVAERAALNAPIQGSAADIIKLAMVQVQQKLQQDKLKARLLLQVHDELVVETNEQHLEQVMSHISETMKGVIDLKVPLEVSVGFGESWLAAAH